jgi:hypothetical protein
VSVMVFVATWVVRVPLVAVTNSVVVLRRSAILPRTRQREAYHVVVLRYEVERTVLENGGGVKTVWAPEVMVNDSVVVLDLSE